VYQDRWGRERKRLLYTVRHATLKAPLTKPASTKTTTFFSHEKSDIADLPAQYVLISVGEITTTPATLSRAAKQFPRA
jgi:hypothetical protein